MIINTSVTTEMLGSKTADAITALQEEVSPLAKVATQNTMALGILLASKGRVCMVINTSCCVYVDQSGRVSTVLNEIWQQTGILHEIQKDGRYLSWVC